ncbi:DUF192 domain-containing protein [Candidatus Woesearchaeota archaeon]|nr:DUF192 domain-containing protein [Candidatus Woesearchaeota archaeon]
MLYNKSKDIVLSKDLRVCTSLWSKATGLMFARAPRTLVFVMPSPQIVPLHMFFVHFPIDVLFLDDKKKVVEIKYDFRPYTIYTPKNRAKYIVEIPQGTADSCQVGDTLELGEKSI